MSKKSEDVAPADLSDEALEARLTELHDAVHADPRLITSQVAQVDTTGSAGHPAGEALRRSSLAFLHELKGLEQELANRNVRGGRPPA